MVSMTLHDSQGHFCFAFKVQTYT